MYSKATRAIGYLKDQKGIINRYINEGKGWQPHVRNCRDIILDFVHGNRFNQIVVLGSGWLIDFPAELFDTAITFHLIDVSHPNQVKHKYRKYNNVVFHEEDITGGAIQQVFEATKLFRKGKTKTSIDKITGNGFTFDESRDAGIISLNILNQLDILLADYLLKFRMYNEEEITRFRNNIQEKHVKTIKGTNSLLITDCVERVYDMEEKPIDTKSLIYTKLQSEDMIRQWDWYFDTTGNYHPGLQTIFTVKAFQFNKNNK